jgi:hypothetical protein
MITYTSTNNKFTATLQGEPVAGYVNVANVYSASRTMLRIKREDTQQVSVVNMSYSGAWGSELPVNYYTDPDGVLEIPLRNIINAHPTEILAAITMLEVDGTTVDALSITLDVLQGLSYLDINAPRSKDADQFLAVYGSVVMPPNIILNPNTLSGLTAPGIIVESNLAYDWMQYTSGVGTVVTPSGARSNELVIAAGADTLKVSHDGKTKSYKLEKTDYCADLVCIRWTSQTGATRQHFFPIVSFIKGSDKQVSLLTSGDGYKVDKNTFEGVRCRLTGLTAYGYWYYMDLLQASDVHAIVKQTFSLWSTEIASEQTAAYVEANEMETPQGNGFFNFEFTLKLRHYGQV